MIIQVYNEITIEIILSGIAICISIYSLYLSKKNITQQNIHHWENLKFKKEKDYYEKKKYYDDEYYNELIKSKSIIQNIPILEDKIGLLFHFYSKNESDYLNSIYENIENSIIQSLGDEIEWQTTDRLMGKISWVAITTAGTSSGHIYEDNIKDNLDKLKNSLNRLKYKELERDFLIIHNEFSKYFTEIEVDTNKSIERINNITKKAENEPSSIYSNLERLSRLLELMSRSKLNKSINQYEDIDILVEDIVEAGIRLKIIDELKNSINKFG